MGGRGGSTSDRGGKQSAPVSKEWQNDTEWLSTQKEINNIGFLKYAYIGDPDAADSEFIAGVDKRNAEEIFDAVKRMNDAFPEVAGFASISVHHMESDVYAHCYTVNGRVEVNPDYFKDYDKNKSSLESDVRMGFHPPGTDRPGATVAHELAHAIDGYLTYKHNIAGFTPSGNYKDFSAMLRPKVMKECGLKISDIPKHVSRYADKNNREWFAEAVSEYLYSPNPRPVALAVGKYVKQYLGLVH